MENNNNITAPSKYTVQWIEQKLDKQIETMNTLLGGRANVAKELAFAAQSINASEYLQKCTPQSILKSVFNISGIGLTLNPVLQQAYIVPRQTKNVWEAHLQPGYQGLIKLLTDGGAVKTIRAHAVYENDVFDYDLGSTWSIKYKPTLNREKGKLVAVFAIAEIEGGVQQPALMSADDVYDVREISTSYQSFLKWKGKCAWVDNEGEMACKTLIRRMQKTLPKSVKNEDKLAKALELDNEDFKPTDNQIVYLEALIETSGYDHDTRQILIDKANGGISLFEFNTMCTELKQNQLNPVTHGGFPSQTQIGAHINKIANS